MCCMNLKKLLPIAAIGVGIYFLSRYIGGTTLSDSTSGSGTATSGIPDSGAGTTTPSSPTMGELYPVDTPTYIPPAPGFCETTGSYVSDMSLCQPWGIPGTVDIHQDPAQYTVPVNLAPPGDTPIIWDTPNVVLPPSPAPGACQLAYSQDGVWSLPRPPGCDEVTVRSCEPGTVPTTMGAGGFGGSINSYLDRGRAICSDCRTGRCNALPVNPLCDRLGYYAEQHNCYFTNEGMTGQTGSG